MRYSKLSQKQKNKILEALEQDGFEKIKDNGTFVSFSKYPRDYELYSLNIQSDFNTDDGLNIQLQEEMLFANLLGKKSNRREINYYDHFKSRHSVSLSHKSDEIMDIEDAIQNISGWKKITAYDFFPFTPNVYSIPTKSNRLIVIDIKGKIHIALNHADDGRWNVYEDTPDIILSLIQAHPESFLDASNLSAAIAKIKEDAKED